MATMRNGLFGGFTGRLGDKVGYIRKGVQYVKLAPKKRTGPVSEAWKAHQEKFMLVVRFLSPLIRFMDEMHKTYPKGKTGYHKLFPTNYREAVTGTYPSLGIDYSKVLLTTGCLPGAGDIEVASARYGILDIRWTDRSVYSSQMSSHDQLYFAAYHEGSKTWEVKKYIAERQAGVAIIDMTPHRGTSLHIYVGFGSANRANVSDSKYLGVIDIL